MVGGSSQTVWARVGWRQGGTGAAKGDWWYEGETDLIRRMIGRDRFLSVREGSYNGKGSNVEWSLRFELELEVPV